jgi:hypothetical protein
VRRPSLEGPIGTKDGPDRGAVIAGALQKPIDGKQARQRDPRHAFPRMSKDLPPIEQAAACVGDSFVRHAGSPHQFM